MAIEKQNKVHYRFFKTHSLGRPLNFLNILCKHRKLARDSGWITHARLFSWWLCYTRFTNEKERGRCLLRTLEQTSQENHGIENEERERQSFVDLIYGRTKREIIAAQLYARCEKCNISLPSESVKKGVEGEKQREQRDERKKEETNELAVLENR